VIVESPAKAKTIEKYLGAGYTVLSSYGHVRDLPERDLSVDVENGFEPNYIIPTIRRTACANCRSEADKATTVWLATDEDREGEAISWHLKEALGLADDKVKRITFNEITKTAVMKAIENPREIDIHLVDAQQARRVLDRLVGYELSPVLWRKVKPGLSAGRVQSVAVRIIVEREREILDFNSKSAFRDHCGVHHFHRRTGEGRTSHPFRHRSRGVGIPSGMHRCEAYTVNAVEKKPGKRTPAAPFTTSTLQQEASRKLGYGVDRTMRIAQGLYEQGHITYMRTDSVNLSEGAIAAADPDQRPVRRALQQESPLHQQEQRRTGSARSHPPCGHDGAQCRRGPRCGTPVRPHLEAHARQPDGRCRTGEDGGGHIHQHPSRPGTEGFR
jgi:DNA topoisomerase-1